MGQIDLLNLRHLLDTQRKELETSVERAQELQARLTATLEEIGSDRFADQVLHESAYARLRARLESQPVIEQAKGVIMVQSGCGPDEAFEILRRASQRTNVRVRDLALVIVNRAAGKH